MIPGIIKGRNIQPYKNGKPKRMNPNVIEMGRVWIRDYNNLDSQPVPIVLVMRDQDVHLHLMQGNIPQLKPGA